MLFFSLDIPRSSYGGTGGRSEYPWLSATELRYTALLITTQVDRLKVFRRWPCCARGFISA